MTIKLIVFLLELGIFFVKLGVFWKKIGTYLARICFFWQELSYSLHLLFFHCIWQTLSSFDHKLCTGFLESAFRHSFGIYWQGKSIFCQALCVFWKEFGIIWQDF